MGQTRRTIISGSTIYGCRMCKTHLASQENLMSKAYNGSHGPALLFHSVVNIELGSAVDRTMTTGLHTVRDVSCIRCKNYLGWKYDRAFSPDQKFKEGHFILEQELLIEIRRRSRDSSGTPLSADHVEEVEMDDEESDDDDENEAY